MDNCMLWKIRGQIKYVMGKYIAENTLPQFV